MRLRDYLIQFFIALTVFAIFSIWIRVPGYMDAEYYTLSATRLATGHGLTQPIIWNFLDDPTRLPYASHTYWMPAPSLVAAAGMRISGTTDFSFGRLPFVLLAALVVPAASWMGWRLDKTRLTGWLSAGLAVFCGYYAPYTSTVDSFFLIMLGAWLILFLVDGTLADRLPFRPFIWLALGLTSGWMHLNRADGFLWLVLTAGFWIHQYIKSGSISTRKKLILYGFLMAAGYISATWFWYSRNVVELGSLFTPHTSRALWTTNYDELFTYPPDVLTYNHWIAAGWGVILRDRLAALGNNLTAVVAVQGLVLLFPFCVAGIWNRRHDPLVQMGIGMEIIILLVMSFVFPYSGRRGGFLHSSAALQPLVWGLSAAGLVDILKWIAPRRNWNVSKAQKMFSPAAIFICAITTIFVYQMMVIGNNPMIPLWEESYRDSVTAKEMISKNGIPASDRIMINNPAGFSLISGRESVVIPYGNPQAALEVAEKFKIEYILLEKNLVSGLMPLYRQPEKFSAFKVVDRLDDKILLKINQSSGGN